MTSTFCELFPDSIMSELDNNFEPDSNSILLKFINTVLEAVKNQVYIDTDPTGITEDMIFGYLNIQKYKYCLGPRNLAESALNGNLALVKYILKHGADIHYFSDIPLRNASRNGHHNIVKFLVENGANIKAINFEAFILACSKGHLQTVKYLWEQGSNTKHCQKWGLSRASLYDRINVVKFLVETKKVKHSINNHMAFIEACWGGSLGTVEYLLEKRADISVRKNSGLNFAIQSRKLPIVKILLEKGAVVGYTEMQCAYTHYNETIIRYLARHKKS